MRFAECREARGFLATGGDSEVRTGDFTEGTSGVDASDASREGSGSTSRDGATIVVVVVVAGDRWGMESEGPAVGVGDFIVVAKKDVGASVEEALFRSSSDSCLTLREVMMMSPFMSGLEDGVDDGGEETGRGGEPLTGAWSCATTTTAGGAGVMGEKPSDLSFQARKTRLELEIFFCSFSD